MFFFDNKIENIEKQRFEEFKLRPTEIVEGTYRAGCGMYIGEPLQPEIKENRNVLITYYPDKTSAYLKAIGTYQKNYKNHKKGEIRYKKYYKKWISPYSSILNAWEAVFVYPTVSYGLTRNERNVFVVDVDEKFEDIQQAKKYILERTSAKPSYIIRNPKSGHIQFGYALRKGIKSWNFQWFNKIIKHLAKKFNSDSAFNGPACKNPYYKDFESEISGIVYNSAADPNLKDLYEDVKTNEVHSPSVVDFSNTVAYKAKALGCEENIENRENINCNNINTSSSHSSFLYNTNPNLKTEENHVSMYMKILRNKIFKYFRETSGKECDIETARIFEKETIKEMTEMGYVFNNMKQTIDATKKIMKWCNTKGLERFGKKNNSKTGENDTSLFQIYSRKKSLETRHEKMQEKKRKFREWMYENSKIVDLESKGKPKKGKISKKEAAKRIGITYDEFRAYMYEVKKGRLSIYKDEQVNEIKVSNEIKENSIEEFNPTFNTISFEEKIKKPDKIAI